MPISAEPGVVARAAGQQQHLGKILGLVGRKRQLEIDVTLDDAHPAAKRVGDGLRLLVDLLVHEVLVATLFGHQGCPVDVPRRAMPGRAVGAEELDFLGREARDLALLDEDHLARLLQQGRDVARDELLAFAQAEHER